VDDDLWSDSEPEEEPEPEPTPAERLLYALGQLYRRWYRGELPVRPHEFDVLELARTIGVSRDVEMVTDPHSAAFHFDGKALVVLPGRPFPWAVWAVEDWAAYSELEDAGVGLDWL
jgi:hypothetical protein